ncbi:hypothetical protein H0H92_006365 [Tricholoma furcatifolium]|nr:hypothetical protein H0H92_006365 [Tricholoma furcatifolium]
MMLALILVHKHKVMERGYQHVDKFHEYLRKQYHDKHGFERLAILFSLPYALLSWALGTFLLAFLLMCVVKSTTAVRLLVSLVVFLACGLTFWCILMFWDTKDWLQLHTFKSRWELTKKPWVRSSNHVGTNDEIPMSDIGTSDTGPRGANLRPQAAASQADASHLAWLKHNLPPLFLRTLTRLTSRFTSAAGVTPGSQV